MGPLFTFHGRSGECSAEGRCFAKTATAAGAQMGYPTVRGALPQGILHSRARIGRKKRVVASVRRRASAKLSVHISLPTAMEVRRRCQSLFSPQARRLPSGTTLPFQAPNVTHRTASEKGAWKGNTQPATDRALHP